jgi:hypothetical protein
LYDGVKRPHKRSNLLFFNSKRTVFPPNGDYKFILFYSIFAVFWVDFYLLMPGVPVARRFAHPIDFRENSFLRMEDDFLFYVILLPRFMTQGGKLAFNSIKDENKYLTDHFEESLIRLFNHFFCNFKN